MIKKFLAQLLEKFKAKNSVAWSIIFAVSMVLQFGLEIIVPGVALPEGLLSLDWILQTFKITLSDTVTDIIMFVLIGITGSKTTADLSADDRNKKIEATKAELSRREQRALAKAERKA